MNRNPKKPPRILIALLILAGLVVGLSVVAYRPDRPVPTIEPGSSSGPTFVAQIIRPRLGLPLGGLLPPRLFGLDPQLVIDSQSPGAVVDAVGPGRIEIAADGWELLLALDDAGRVSSETQVVFELVFEDELRRVRCRTADPAEGTISTTVLDGGNELSGGFDIELPHCEDAATGESLDWPASPLLLHGSFDRLPLRTDKPE